MEKNEKLTPDQLKQLKVEAIDGLMAGLNERPEELLEFLYMMKRGFEALQDEEGRYYAASKFDCISLNLFFIYNSLKEIKKAENNLQPSKSLN